MVKPQVLPRNQKFVPSDVTNFGIRQSTKSWISGVNTIRHVDSFKLNWTNGKRRASLLTNFKGSESGEKTAGEKTAGEMTAGEKTAGEKTAGRRSSVVGFSKSFAGKRRARAEIHSEGGIDVSEREKKLGKNKWNSFSGHKGTVTRVEGSGVDRSSNFEKYDVEDSVLRKIQTSENQDLGSYPNLVNFIIKNVVI